MQRSLTLNICGVDINTTIQQGSNNVQMSTIRCNYQGRVRLRDVRIFVDVSTEVALDGAALQCDLHVQNVVLV